MFYITSDRLKLIPLTHQQLQLWAGNNRTALEKELALNPNKWITAPDIQLELDDAILNTWLPGTAQNPENYAWFTTWEIILQEKNISVGGIGLTGLPDANGETMVGYGIDEKFQKMGIASEALQCLSGWVFTHPGAQAIVATTPPDNYPSHKVLLKNGFVNLGQLDEYVHWRLARV